MVSSKSNKSEKHHIMWTRKIPSFHKSITTNWWIELAEIFSKNHWTSLSYSFASDGPSAIPDSGMVSRWRKDLQPLSQPKPSVQLKSSSASTNKSVLPFTTRRRVMFDVRLNTFCGHSLFSTQCNNIQQTACSTNYGYMQVRQMASLRQMHRTGPHVKVRPKKQPLDGKPFMKGVVLKPLIKKPKKPNSANRKCVLVRLSNGREAIAYIPGIGHNLQEHNIVLVRVGRLQDVPGVKLKCVRGVYDLPHVVKQKVA